MFRQGPNPYPHHSSMRATPAQRSRGLNPNHHHVSFSVDDLTAGLSQMEISTFQDSKPHPNQAFYDNPTFIDTNTNPKTDESHIVDLSKEQLELDELFQQSAEEIIQELDPFIRPAGLKTTTELRTYQEDGVRYLLDREKNPKPNPFIRVATLNSGETAYYDRYSQRRLEQPHAPARGSILADDMGSGKTLQTLCLILSNPPKGHVYGSNETNAEGPVCTLIVCNKTVLPHWDDQIKKFLEPNTLRVEWYVGPRKARSKLVEKVRNNEIDVLLTTYGMVSSEYDNPEYHPRTGEILPSIFDTSFHRLVLDESQKVRNSTSQGSRGALELARVSSHVLGLSGTPFINKPEDLYPLLAVIGLEPFSNQKYFRDAISAKIRKQQRCGLTRLREALRHVLLRRSKAAAGLAQTLPKKMLRDISVVFPDGEHKAIHNCLYELAQAGLDGCINGGINNGLVSYNLLFAAVNRIRMSCASGALVPAAVVQRLQEIINNGLPRREDGSLSQLSPQDGADILAAFLGQENDDKIAHDKELPPSPKIFHLLKRIAGMKPDEKGVIFSQWTSFLDLIEQQLKKAGYPLVRIDGRTTLENRAAAMDTLANNDQVRLILCSYGAAGEGSRANHVFLMDTWWNLPQEYQAIDRCHRIGQERPVFAYRFIMRGTIEEKMRAYQKAKAMIGKGTMKKLSKREEEVARMPLIKEMLGVNTVEIQWDD